MEGIFVPIGFFLNYYGEIILGLLRLNMEKIYFVEMG